MKLLLDQDVYAITAGYLRDLGHDVVTTADIDSARASDEALLRIAQQQGRLFVTRDRDFGGLVFVRDFGAGVIYLRSIPAIIHAVHEERDRVLASYSEADLHKAFVVVERPASISKTFSIETIPVMPC